jgi:hypothetical protein
VFVANVRFCRRNCHVLRILKNVKMKKGVLDEGVDVSITHQLVWLRAQMPAGSLA